MTLSEGSSNEKMILSAGITEDMQGFGTDKVMASFNNYCLLKL